MKLVFFNFLAKSANIKADLKPHSFIAGAKSLRITAAALLTTLSVNSFAIEKRPFDFVVGVDGDFKAAMAAAAAANPSDAKRFVIFFPDGEYDLTNLTADSHGKTAFKTSYVSLIGQTRDRAIIANKTDTEGISLTATLYFPNNNGMYLQDLTIQNKSSYATSSAARQVTVQQIGDKYIFKNVRLLSGQDTYYTNKAGRTYWEGGEIQGTVDFICGDGDVFFEGTNLVMTRNGGYITAAKTSSQWGYVFNNATINVSNGSYNGTFYLGRSWGHAKTVFLNTTMYAQPKAEGWGPDMNAAPDVYGEYNSKDGNGNSVNVSNRKTYFNGGKDASTAKSLKTVWSASDASQYTLANVLGGSDNWEPNKLTIQVEAPRISQEGAEITWDDNEDARCWAVFVNGSYKGNTATNSFPIDGIAVGSKVTVRSANSMGGLGSASNEIEIVEDNSTYFSIKIPSVEETVGGVVTVEPARSRMAEGSIVTFTATPNEGWTFEGWAGANASDATAASENTTAKNSWTTKVTSDLELSAVFSAKGKNTFQAESGIISNGVSESSNAGFEGSGYVNFYAGNSNVKVPVYVEAAGTYTMEMRFANGSPTDRDLSIQALAVNEDPQVLTFETTGAWTTYITKKTEVKLPRGASFIQFAVVGDNDGPNLDQILLTPLDVEHIAETSSDSAATDSSLSLTKKLQVLPVSETHLQIFSIQGKLIHNAFIQGNWAASLENLKNRLPAGNYLLRMVSPGLQKQMIIRIP